MIWDKETFYQFIIENQILGFFKEPIKLKSGRLSSWYVNWRNVAEDVYSIDILTDFLISFVNQLNFDPDCFFGVPEGATKIGVLTQFKWAKSKAIAKGKYVLSMGRAQPKEHGDTKDRFFLGEPKGKTIILEDVTTTGGSLISTIEQLKSIDVEIIAAIGLTNRNELRDDGKAVEEAVKDKGVRYYAMSDAIELLPRIYNILKPGLEIAKHVEEYFEKYGIKQLKLKD